MAQKNKAVKSLESIFPEITEEQTEAICKLFDKQASEHAEEVENLREQLTAANNQLTLHTTKVVGFLFQRPLHCYKSFSFTRSPQA